MKRDFEKFLKQHRDYRRYFRNLKAYNGDAWESVYNNLLKDPKELILDAFMWSNTTEKGEYWLQVHFLWRKQLEKKGNKK